MMHKKSKIIGIICLLVKAVIFLSIILSKDIGQIGCICYLIVVDILNYRGILY